MNRCLAVVGFSFLLSLQLNAQVTFTNAFPNLAFNRPIELQTANDGTNRAFVIQQSGLIYVFPNSPTVASPQRKVFLDLTSRIVFNSNEERGLLGLAFHPNYASNRYFYVYYTENNAGLTQMVLARYQASSINPDSAVFSSEIRLLAFTKNQSNTNHNGGKIAFGSDGYLYASIGDGGGGGDPMNNAQDTSRFFGKVLRIDVDLRTGNQVMGNYAIPADNPFAASNATRKEIYAWGIRNMWKFSFDFPTNRLWGADVGQNAFEEINLVENGKNYGWRKYEGNSIFSSGDPEPANPTFPIYTYAHASGSRSITGGYVYRGASMPELAGKYIYGDFVSGNVWALTYDGVNPTTNEFLFSISANTLAGFGVDAQNELYICSFDGSIYKLISGSTPPAGQSVAGIGGWSAFGSGTDGLIKASAVAPNGDVLIGGSFSTVNGVLAKNIARWNRATGWSALGSGVQGVVNALAIDENGDVYAGGAFTSVSGVLANNIARWNGTTWSALGSGVIGYVSVLATNGGNLFVGGAFSTAGGIVANNIARWNGTTWSALGSGTVGTNNEVRALALRGSDIFVGGNFSFAGETPASCIARWSTSSSQWNALGSGTSGFVQAITIDGDNVYAGGSFAQAGGHTVNRVARWSIASSQWNALASGVSGAVNALAVENGSLFVGGSFNVADALGENSRVRNIAQWNGVSWTALGVDTAVGANGTVNSLSIQGSRIFVSGFFSQAGNLPANNLAEWSLPSASQTQMIASNGIQPFSGTGITIDFSNVSGGGNVTVQRFSDPATNVTGVPNTNQSAYRFVITQTGLSGFNALLRFNRNEISQSGITNPATVTVYRRATPGSGEFTALPNAYNGGFPDEIRALTTGFSEFIFGSGDDNPLPVSLSHFSGEALSGAVQLRWKTQSEQNNEGFLIIRDGNLIDNFYSNPSLRGKVNSSAESNYLFRDNAVEACRTYVYKLQSVDVDGAIHTYPDEVQVEAIGSNSTPREFSLLQNFPNPFNPTTIIRYEIAEVTDVRLELFDILGRKVETLVNMRQGAGAYETTLDARNLSSGIYFYQLRAGRFSKSLKLLITK